MMIYTLSRVLMEHRVTERVAHPASGGQTHSARCRSFGIWNVAAPACLTENGRSRLSRRMASIVPVRQCETRSWPSNPRASLVIRGPLVDQIGRAHV